MNREIKFRRAHYWKEAFLKFTYWGFIDDSFISPSHISCSDSNTDEQFTGLHDKNGKEIFEGDLIKADSFDTKMLIVWRNDLASFALSADGWIHDHYFGEGADPGYCIITGNIHDND